MNVPTHSSAAAKGAYGFRVAGVERSADRLSPVPADAPRLTLERVRGRWPERPPVINERVLDLGLAEGVWLTARPDSETVTFTAERALDDEELIHPLLAPAAAVHWMWLGREALHAGAVAVGGDALLLLGPNEAGKSTTLAHLTQRPEVAVMCDDLAVVTADLDVLAGPRSIDQRPETPPRDLPPADSHPAAVPVRGGSRRRQRLAPAPPSARVRGWVQLAWSDQLELAPLDGAARMRALAQARRSRSLAGDPITLLELAALPAYRLARPRRLDTLAASVERLLSVLG